MSENKNIYSASLCLATSLVLIWRWWRDRTRLPHPPGPKGLPLVGNVMDIPPGVPVWHTFTSLARNFNTDILFLKLFATNFVILSNPDIVSDLHGKRSRIYSGRPQIPILELMGHYSWATSLMEYGSRWRAGRRLLHEFLNIKAVERFDDYQRKHAYRLLSHLVDSPEDFFRHAEFTVAALVMETAYGFDVTTSQDRFLRAAEEGTRYGRPALVPGAFLVNSVPILKYVPEWFPGAGFKTFARVSRERFNAVITEPCEYVKESIKSGGNGNASMAWSCLCRMLESPNRGFDEDTIRGTTATIYVVAVETTAAALRTFFLAMALNPHVVRKAQEELDRVVGAERLPDYSDEENLPYISAVIKELHRWGCVLPTGFPRQVTEDDIYNGYLIPAGATIIENMWAIFHDESTYPAPHTYEPERFIKDGELDVPSKDPEEIVFGRGRRSCVGRHFAKKFLFLNISCVLALFDIEAPNDGSLRPTFHEDHSFIRDPIPFKCTIKPRSDASLKSIKAACATVDQ